MSKSLQQETVQTESGICCEADDSNSVMRENKEYSGKYNQKDVLGQSKPIVPEFLTLSMEPSFSHRLDYLQSNHIRLKTKTKVIYYDGNNSNDSQSEFMSYGPILRLMHFGSITEDYTMLIGLFNSLHPCELNILIASLKSLSVTILYEEIYSMKILLLFLEAELIVGRNTNLTQFILKIVLDTNREIEILGSVFKIKKQNCVKIYLISDFFAIESCVQVE